MKKQDASSKHSQMVDTPVPGLIGRMSMPFIFSQLVTIAYNTADTWFVSRINTSASAAIGIAFSLMQIIQALGYGVGVGAASIVSRSLGAKKDSYAETVSSSGFVFSILVGAVFGCICLLFLSPLMVLIGATDSNIGYAAAYSRYILIGAPFICASYLLHSLLRAEGEPEKGILGLSVGGILNVFLDGFLVLALGLGTGGAAIATLISQLVSTVILFCIFQSKGSILHFRMAAVSRDLKMYRSIAAIGFPTTCRLGLSGIAASWLNNVAKGYGDAAISAITITNKIYIMLRHIIVGLGQCLQTVSGYNYGAGRNDRVKSAFWFTCFIGTAFCTVSAILLAAFSSDVIGWFRNDPDVIAIGSRALLLVCLSIPMMAYSTNTSQMFQSLGFKKSATVLACCRHGICFVPLILLLPRLFLLPGVEWVQPGADILTFVITIPFQIFVFRKKLRKS